jgi:hypothetical protein
MIWLTPFCEKMTPLSPFVGKNERVVDGLIDFLVLYCDEL